MANYNKEILKENVLQLIEYAGLTDEQFVNIIDISVRKLQYLKNNEVDKAKFTIEDIEKISILFNRDFIDITTKSIQVSSDFRNELLNTHRGNIEYTKILEDRPSIPYAIKFVLVEDLEFQNTKLEVKHILKIFQKYGWVYKSSSVSNELKKLVNIIHSETHPSKKLTNLYSRK